MLTIFCRLSGQEVSKEKSRVLFSKNTPGKTRSEICCSLGILEAQKFDKCLEFPLKFSDRGSRDFNFIIHKVQEKLTGWQASLLSPAGKRTRIKSSSGAIPDYVMHGALLPIRVCKKIDHANRNFLWGSTPEKRKMHLENWDTVTRPKDHGGLGIHETRPRNLALIAKLNWKLLLEDPSLWAYVLKAKYLSSNISRNLWASKGSCSRTWAACKAAKLLLDSGLIKVIITGAFTSLWYDNWTSNGPLRAQLIGPLNIGEETQLVSQAIDNYGNWNLQLSFDLPNNVIKLIQVIPTNLAS